MERPVDAGFWGGVAAMAGVASVALALWVIVRSRAMIVVEIRRHPFHLPPGVASASEVLADTEVTLSGLESADPLPPAQEARVRGLLRHLVETLDSTHLLGYRQPESYVTITLTNRGHEQVNDVEVRLPSAIVTVIEGGQDKISDPTRIAIPTLRPGDTITIASWGRSWYSHNAPTVVASRGRPRVREYSLAPSWLAEQHAFFSSEIGKWFVLSLLIGILSAVLVGLGAR
jgi:hypothetical protein